MVILEHVVMIFAVVFSWGIAYFFGWDRGWDKAKDEFYTPTICPHGYDWDDCPDCRH